MRGKVGLDVKRPGNKEKDSFSNKPKSGFSQSVDINSPVEQVLQLQRTIGNQAVTRLIQSGAIRAEIRIGQPDDMYEKEADRVAEQVMRMAEGSLVNGHWSLGRKESEQGSLAYVLQQNKDSRMVQAQAGGAASLAGLTARRTAFNNTGTTNAANCCGFCPLTLGVGVDGGALNGMEIEYTLRGTIPRGTEFDILRTVRGAMWVQDRGRWRRVNTIPAGTNDDPDNDDECLIPNRRRIFVIDTPGLASMNPRGIRLNGYSVPATATAYVGKLNFYEWVIARNRRLGIGWTRISQPTFTQWHSITSLGLVGGTWRRVNNPPRYSNEIELGTVNTTGNTP